MMLILLWRYLRKQCPPLETQWSPSQPIHPTNKFYIFGKREISLLLHCDGPVNSSVTGSDYMSDELDLISADAAAGGRIYSFFIQLSVGASDVEALRAMELRQTTFCDGTVSPAYRQFRANADTVEAGVSVECL